MNNSLRQINLDGVTFKWRVSRRPKRRSVDLGRAVCVDRLAVFHAGTSNAPLRIIFTEGAIGRPGYIPRDGVVMFYASALVINLHKPKTVEILARRALALGWSTEDAMQIDDGFAFVQSLPTETLRLIDASHQTNSVAEISANNIDT